METLNSWDLGMSGNGDGADDNGTRQKRLDETVVMLSRVGAKDGSNGTGSASRRLTPMQSLHNQRRPHRRLVGLTTSRPAWGTPGFNRQSGVGASLSLESAHYAHPSLACEHMPVLWFLLRDAGHRRPAYIHSTTRLRCPRPIPVKPSGFLRCRPCRQSPSPSNNQLRTCSTVRDDIQHSSHRRANCGVVHAARGLRRLPLALFDVHITAAIALTSSLFNDTNYSLLPHSHCCPSG
jgi:hypothetical protein